VDDALALELAVGLAHRVGVDAEVDGELADGGEGVVGCEGVEDEGAPDLVDDLEVDGPGIVRSDGDEHAVALCIR
jgi:hypothetical protein